MHLRPPRYTGGGETRGEVSALGKERSCSEPTFTSNGAQRAVDALVLPLQRTVRLLCVYRICASSNYSINLLTTPAPTVFPPSRKAKRMPSCASVAQRQRRHMWARKTQNLHSHRVDEVASDLSVIAGHHHLCSRGRASVRIASRGGTNPTCTDSDKLTDPVTSAVRKKNCKQGNTHVCAMRRACAGAMPVADSS